MTRINKAGVEFIKLEEGLRLAAYKDSGGLPTIGWGHILGVKMGDVMTLKQAQEALANDIAHTENLIRPFIKRDLTQNQWNAVVSFAFNLGWENFAGSTLLKCINAGDFKMAQSEFHRWIYVGKTQSDGLRGRRAREAKVFGLPD